MSIHLSRLTRLTFVLALSLALALMASTGELHAQAAPAQPTAGLALQGQQGKLAPFEVGARVFANREFTLLSVPAELEGMQFVQAPIDAMQSIACLRPGPLTVITPADPRHNSNARALLQQGFTQVNAAPFQPFGDNPIDLANIYRKDMAKGEVLRLRKWALLVLPADAAYTAVNPSAQDWSQNTGEVLYNGIVLPEVWPPVYMSPQMREPMPVPYLQHPPAVIPIDLGRQLFVDDFLIEETTLRRNFHQAQKYEHNPVFKAETEQELAIPEVEFYENGTVFLGHGGVFFDPQDKLFKMFYGAGWRGGLALATSPDLVHWTRPDLGIVGHTNLLIPRGVKWQGEKMTVAGTDNAVWLDLNTDNPDERLKFMTCWMHVNTPEERPEGFHHTLHASADGRIWSDAVPVSPPAEDYSSFFYNPFRDVWVFSMKVGSSAGRSRLYLETKDFFAGGDQSKSVYWTHADKLDFPEPLGSYPGAGDPAQLYSLGAVAYESIFIGMHYIHRGPANEVCGPLHLPKLMDLELGFSRDGFHWDRPDRRGFIRGSRTEGTWDRAYLHGTTGMFAVVGDLLVFPYMGTSGPSPTGSTSMYSGGAVGLAMLRRDGFASMDTGLGVRQKGTLTTRPVVFSGSRLFINADVPAGSIRAEVRDLDGNPVAPFTLENSVSFTGDSTLAQLDWKGSADGDISALAGQPVRLHFEVTEGSLYAFWISPDASGRSDGYLAAGGPGYPGVIDTVGRYALEVGKKTDGHFD